MPRQEHYFIRDLKRLDENFNQRMAKQPSIFAIRPIPLFGPWIATLAYFGKKVMYEESIQTSDWILFAAVVFFTVFFTFSRFNERFLSCINAELATPSDNKQPYCEEIHRMFAVKNEYEYAFSDKVPVEVMTGLEDYFKTAKSTQLFRQIFGRITNHTESYEGLKKIYRQQSAHQSAATLEHDSEVMSTPVLG